MDGSVMNAHARSLARNVMAPLHWSYTRNGLAQLGFAQCGYVCAERNIDRVSATFPVVLLFLHTRSQKVCLRLRESPDPAPDFLWLEG